MAKKARKPKIAFDLTFGIGDIIPSTREAFKGEKFDGDRRKIETEAIKVFKENVAHAVSSRMNTTSAVSTTKDILIFIVQYFVSEREYKSRDCDNMAKTVLDSLKGLVYQDDGQVRTLVVSKKIHDTKIPQNFAFIAVKILPNDNDTDVLTVCGIEAAIALFTELQQKYII